MKITATSPRPLLRSQVSLNDEERFWRSVVKSPDCWLWRSKAAPYGRFYVRAVGRQHAAHRVSAALAYGDLAHGAVVMHLCDTPRCVRPDHLRVATQRDNVRDMLDKGRDNPTTPRGSFHGDKRKKSPRACKCGHPEHEHLPVGVDFRAFYGCLQRITAVRCECRYFIDASTLSTQGQAA